MQDRITAYAILAGLASAIPVPVLDDAVKNRIQRRMVAALAQGRGVPLAPEQVAQLADDRSTVVRGAVTSLALWPLKRALQKTFLILGLRRVAVLTSECYLRALLIDHALAVGACAAAGGPSAEAVREAIDQVLREVSGGPIERAMVAAFGESRSLIIETLESWRARLSRRRGEEVSSDADGLVDELVRPRQVGLDGLVARVRQAVAEVGRDHVDELLRRLDERLPRR